MLSSGCGVVTLERIGYVVALVPLKNITNITDPYYSMAVIMENCFLGIYKMTNFHVVLG